MEERKEVNSFIKYIVKSMLAQVGISIYILGDTYFISVYSGADGLAALNLIIPILCLIYAIGCMISMGFATRFKIDRAKGLDVKSYFTESIIWSLISGLPFTLIGFICPKELAILLGSIDLAYLGTPYLQVILLASPLFIANYTFIAFTRNDNDPSLAMLGSLFGSLFNLVFDYIFMFIFDWGLRGAAIATACCPIVTSLVCSTHFKKKINTIFFSFKNLCFKRFINCLKLGTPALMGELSTAVCTLIFNLLILNISGANGVAAFGVIINISCVFVAIFNGLSEGAQPLISDNYGKGNIALMKRLLMVAFKIVILLEALILIVTLTMPEGIISLFNTKENVEMAKIANIGMVQYFPGFIFFGINTLFLMYFSATDRPKPASTLAWLRGVVFITIFAVVLSHFFGMAGIWYSFGLTELVTFITLFIILKHYASKKN